MTPVSTSLRFASLFAGPRDTCGLTTDNVAYCWGDNTSGQLGVATTEICGDAGPNTTQVPCATRPRAVDTALRFLWLAVGFQHTCGVATDSRADCWGSNSDGQLGDGTRNDSAIPVRVKDLK